MKLTALPPAIPERWRRRHPLIMGVIEGLFVSAVLALAWSIGLSMLAGVAWVLIVWAALAAARPSTYQALIAIALALMFDALSGATMGTRMLPLAGALLAASFAPGPVVRWSISHAIFALYALGGYVGVGLAVALFDGSGAMFLARLSELPLTLLVMALCFAVVAAWQHGTNARTGATGMDVPVLVRSLR